MNLKNRINVVTNVWIVLLKQIIKILRYSVGYNTYYFVTTIYSSPVIWLKEKGEILWWNFKSRKED